MADRFREYGRCVVVCDARVYDIYEEQKSLKTVEEVMVFFADVGLMRRETPLLIGGG